MRILLDECVPRPLAEQLGGFDVTTVVDEGWAGYKNGDLLSAMRSAGFTVLVTTDRNLRYQQNLREMGIAVLVLIAHTNRMRDLLPLVPALVANLSNVKIGHVTHVTA